MALKLMYITNKPAVAKIAEASGVDWIFLDMEFIGKDARQGGLDTVRNHHTVQDIQNIKAVVNTAKVLVRVNPIHETIANYPSSKDEIDEVIEAGADIIMLPFFKTVKEVKSFVKYVDGRAKTCLLLETAEAAILIDEILNVPGIDMIHIGLNDLHLELGMKFMFQLLTDGVVEQLGNKIKAKGIPFGFGGIARLDTGMLPGSDVLKEHVRLGSNMVIVSRSFCNTDVTTDLEEVRNVFTEGIRAIRKLEAEAEAAANYFKKNQEDVALAVNNIVELIEQKEYGNQ
jgi:2-keto-3-deoxy-L-rhamnonate aldolase RhmA